MTGRRHAINPIEAATVMGLRLLGLGMMAANPTAARRNEAQRMILEKQMALLDGIFAMQMEWAKLLTTPFWLWPKPAALAQELRRVATRPAARRVAANARRLKARKSL
jgi:hypothetical protein